MIDHMSFRIFTLADQVAFSELSGDNNPLHIDPIIARRCLFGRPIVHGMHSLMWALDKWMESHQKPTSLRFIQASFLRPIGLEQPVQLALFPSQNQRVRMELLVEGVVAAKMSFEWTITEQQDCDQINQISPHFPQQQPPDFLIREEISSKSGVLNLHLPAKAMQQHFPQLAGYLCPFQAATLLGASRLVGVKCPGLQSIFSELTLAASDTFNSPEIKYAVTQFDERYGMVLMEVATPGMGGSIKAFIRPHPQPQSPFLELKKQVAINEFSGERALVIGGARGLGEVTAKLLAAGGAQVQLTYHLGRTDAQRVAGEIAAGGGLASAHPFNILEPKSTPPGLETPTHLYYFATPFITASIKKQFSPDLFNSFCNYYVNGFAGTVENLRKAGVQKVFYPSTIFIDELPLNLIEYTVAKMAGEAVCQALGKKYPEMRICSPRLPKMATDQTIGLLPVRNPDPAPIMLKALRDFHS